MMVRGRVVMSARGEEVLANPEMREIFLGARGPEPPLPPSEKEDVEAGE
jgi:hypothetical protein